MTKLFRYRQTVNNYPTEFWLTEEAANARGLTAKDRIKGKAPGAAAAEAAAKAKADAEAAAKAKADAEGAPEGEGEAAGGAPDGEKGAPAPENKAATADGNKAAPRSRRAR